MKFGILGSGSWATALAKILTDNGNKINWWIRNQKVIDHLMERHHNSQYLSSCYFDKALLNPSTDVKTVIESSDCIIIAIPSAYVVETLGSLDKNIFSGKKIISAIKGILPEENLLMNDYLSQHFKLPLSDYFAVLGPCHAEEVAAEKLSYLTFSGIDIEVNKKIADFFKSDYITIVENNDIYGVQFAAILKNIYALGAGIAHGLDYGDNFLSVLIANCADEMAGFLKQAGIRNIEVGHLPHSVKEQQDRINYAASVYLGDLLVTCYSLFSRNRTFGNMIGKGYSVKSAQLEMNMVAEGYNASRCMHVINKKINAEMPIADAIYSILWENVRPAQAIKKMEGCLV
ncbi:MAG: NAD(P)H-dependent glycerol-3-phosphate dehydrogenase [Ginsengibacter sp.]